MDDDTRNIEHRLSNLEGIVRNIAHYVGARHTDDCIVTKLKDKLRDKSTTKFEDGTQWFCYCTNKSKHSEKCMPHLMNVLSRMCDCHYNDIRKLLEKE